MHTHHRAQRPVKGRRELPAPAGPPRVPKQEKTATSKHAAAEPLAPACTGPSAIQDRTVLNRQAGHGPPGRAPSPPSPRSLPSTTGKAQGRMRRSHRPRADTGSGRGPETRRAGRHVHRHQEEAARFPKSAWFVRGQTTLFKWRGDQDSGKNHEFAEMVPRLCALAC